MYIDQAYEVKANKGASNQVKTSCREKVSRIWKMFLKPYKYRDYSSKEKEFLYVLQTRAWLLHSLYTFQRIVSWMMGTSLWLGDECKQREVECPEYNRELIDKVTPTVRVYI